MRIQAADLVYYNANTSGNNVGDCVKRAISLALGISYEDAGKELRAAAGYWLSDDPDAWKQEFVYEKVLKRHGCTKIEDHYTDREVITLNDWADTHPQGTFVLSVGPTNANYSNHLVCVIDGMIYDSWNSKEKKVLDAWKVPGGPTIHSDLDVASIHPKIHQLLIDLCNKYVNQFLIPVTFAVRDYGTSGHYNGTFYISAKLNDPSGPYRYLHLPSTSLKMKYTLNPSFDQTENEKRVLAKCKQRAYDWIYNVKKCVNDFVNGQKIQADPSYRGEKANLMDLPEWVRSRATYFVKNRFEAWSHFPFELSFRRLEDDPEYDPSLDNSSWNNNIVTLHADSLRELKNYLQEYYDTRKVVEA